MPGPVVVQILVCLVVLSFFCQQIAFQSLHFEGQYGKVYDFGSEALIISHTLFLKAIIPRMVWITKC